MDYETVRSLIQSGDVIAFETSRWSLFSQLISLWTRSRYSHVGIVMKVHGRLAVIEALEGVGVRIHPLSRLVTTRRLDWFKLDRDQVNRIALVGDALSHWGQRYASPWQFIRSFSVITKRILDKWGLPNDVNTERFFCSEFVMHAMRRGGYQGDAPASARTTPDDITRLPCLTRQGSLEVQGG